MSDTSNQHSYAVIMAGGSGTRLWPLSRKDSPKQFQRFTSSKTMIQETYDRVTKIVPPGNIYVSTTRGYKELVLEQLPDIGEEKLILEPKSHNTAPAIALVAETLRAIDPKAIIATIASDHAIENTAEFVATIRAAFETVVGHQDKLVTVGINPTHPDTSLGYIKMGKELEKANGHGKRVFVVDAFKEKPDQKTAEKYLESWEYLWNAGYFIFSAKTFAEWTADCSPALHSVMEQIAKHRSADTFTEKALGDLYGKTPNEPIDTLIVEKLPPEKRLVIPSALKWSDVGSWGALYDFLQERVSNTLIARGNHIDLGSKDSLVFGNGRLIATLGLENIVVIDTEDTLLVARRNQVSGEIKKLIEKLKSEGKELYL